MPRQPFLLLLHPSAQFAPSNHLPTCLSTTIVEIIDIRSACRYAYRFAYCFSFRSRICLHYFLRCSTVFNPYSYSSILVYPTSRLCLLRLPLTSPSHSPTFYIHNITYRRTTFHFLPVIQLSISPISCADTLGTLKSRSGKLWVLRHTYLSVSAARRL